MEKLTDVKNDQMNQDQSIIAEETLVVEEMVSETRLEESFKTDISDQEDTIGPWWLMIFAALAVIVIAVFVVVLSRRKRKAAITREFEPSTVTEPLDADDIAIIGKESERLSAKFISHVQRDAGRIEMNAESIAKQETIPVDKAEGTFSVGYAQTVGARENQEDAYGISSWNNEDVIKNHGLLAVLCDGIGGLDNGQVASSTTVRTLCAFFERQDPYTDPADRLLDLAAVAQKEVLRINHQGNKCGTTLLSVLIKDMAMSLLSIGDSRVCLYRSGLLLQLNREHILARELDENRLLNNDQSYVTDGRRYAITSYIGKENMRLIDRTLTPMQLIHGDKVVLMSDGVFGTLDDRTIIGALALEPTAAAESIINAVNDLANPNQDNATIVVIGVN